YQWDAQFMPHPMEPMPEDMRVMAVEGGNYGVGQLQMVSISGGANQGLEAGHVFSAFTPGERIRDDVKYPQGTMADMMTWDGDKVTLPDEYNAHIMVIRVFDEVSYAMVMNGARAVHEFDTLRHPDETL
ncbi:MAG: peptidoglycan-binding protein LysM, partial [Lysobacterales bacterium]